MYACIRCFLVLRTIDYTLYITLFLCTLKLDSKLHYVRDGLIKETRREIFNIDRFVSLFSFSRVSLTFVSLSSWGLRPPTHVRLHHRDRDSTILNIIYNL